MTCSASNGEDPVAAWTIITAQEKTSAAGVSGCPSTCSGAMNIGVPIMPVVPETCPLRSRAMPKSTTRGPSGPRMTLAGLTSRCTRPASWIARSAVIVPTASRSSDVPESGPSTRTCSASDGPGMNSLTMYGVAASRSAASTRAVQKGATRRAADTSLPSRARAPGSVSQVAWRALTATSPAASECPW